MPSRNLRRLAIIAFLPTGPLFVTSTPEMRVSTVLFIAGAALLGASAVLLALARVHTRCTAAQRLALSALMDAGPVGVDEHRRLRSVR